MTKPAPYRDDKDILLAYLLLRDISTGTTEGDFKPKELTITGVEKYVKDINIETGDWIEFSKDENGISARILPLYKKDARNFLDFGGFTRVASDVIIKDEECLNLLIGIKRRGGEMELSKAPEWEWIIDPRIKKVVNALIAKEYLTSKEGSDKFYKIKLTPLGAKSAYANQLLSGTKKWDKRDWKIWLFGIIASVVAQLLYAIISHLAGSK